jgi:RNA polymerase sigma factor (sigma-70 family)
MRAKSKTSADERATAGSGSVPDAELAQAASQGDKHAFVEIVSRHQAMVCGIALCILGDFAESEDAGQEAFLTAWRKLDDLRNPERLRGWLAQIARNTALEHLRRRRKADPLDASVDLPDESPGPDQLAASKEEAAMVRASLEQLPETYRFPLVLYYRENQSVRAVAESLEISENAVKQRLARGREMLRNQMAGLIETVLARTGPTAVFTMSVAGAIGALAAPAAVAGSIFGSASVAPGASVSAGVSASAVTSMTMSTSKSLLVATVCVAAVCVPIGYHVAPGTTPQLAEVIPSEIQLGAAPAQPARPAFEESALFAEWRQLHETHGTDAEAMPVLYQAILEIEDPFRRRAFHTALVAEWAQVDSSAGFAFLLSKGADSAQRRQFFEEWLGRDPEAAVAALLNGGQGWEQVARSSLSQIVRQAPSQLAEICSRLSQPEHFWDRVVRDAFAIFAEGDLPLALKEAYSVTGPNRDQALEGIAQVWAKSDFEGAIEWARNLPAEIDRDEVVRAALLGRAAVDPVTALESIGLVPSGGRHAHFASTTAGRVLAEASNANFEDTVAYVARNPGRFSNEDLLGIAREVTARLNADPFLFLAGHADDGTLPALLPAIESALMNNASAKRAEVWEWLKTQPDSAASSQLRRQILSSAAWQDPELAMGIAADLPLTPEGDSEVRLLADSLLDGGSMLHQFDKLLQDAPERLLIPLTESVFKLLSAAPSLDPQFWISRLELLPESSRAQAIESFARAWTAEAPEEAVDWAAALPAGEERAHALSAITSTWANKDAHGAAEYLAAMPPGPERDRSVGSWITAAGKMYPAEAWDWALSIQDNAERNRAAAHALKMMAARDSATAHRMIDDSPFAPEVKAQLRTTLPKP